MEIPGARSAEKEGFEVFSELTRVIASMYSGKYIRDFQKVPDKLSRVDELTRIIHCISMVARPFPCWR